MNRLRLLTALWIVSLLSSAIPGAWAQTTWHVDLHGVPPGTGTSADPYTSLQYAINRPSTVNGDTLLVAPGEYLETVTTQVGFTYKALTLRSSSGPGLTSIRSNAITVVDLTNSTLEGFTVRSVSGLAGFDVSACNSSVRGCVLCGNWSGLYACVDSHLLGCTITGTVHPLDVSVYDVLEIRDTICWGNAQHATNVNTTASYSLFDSNMPGTGNLEADPLFWNAALGDFRLRPGSPCIDAANPALPLDPDGSPADIGAFTYDPNYAPDAVSYCSGKLTSQGCVPVISAFGHASASEPSPFWVYGDQAVDLRAGLLLYGLAQQANPFQGGTLCVGQFRRTPSQNSGGSGPCTGHWQFDMNARIQSGIDPALVPGTLVSAQWWGRDGADPAGFGSQLSDALLFGIAP